MQRKNVPVRVAAATFRQLALLSEAWKESPEFKDAQKAEQSTKRAASEIDPGFPEGSII